MKKFKHFVLMLMAVVMVLTIPFSTACKTDDTPPDGPDEPPVDVNPPAPVTTELLGITVDATNARTEYYVGQIFSDRGLVVTAETKRSDRDQSQTQVVTNYSVDQSEYRDRVGEYTIRVSYTFGETTKEASYKITVNDVKLDLNTDAVKTSYLVGEEFDSTGLTASATTIKPNADPVSKDVTAQISVDASKYNKNAQGDYPITVNYTDGVVARSASFDVSVKGRKDGLNVTLLDNVAENITLTSDKTEGTITLSQENPSATIDPSKIAVRTTDDYGLVIEDSTLAASDYIVEVAKNGEWLEAPYTNLGEGTYQIWAYSENGAGYMRSDFAIIYVVDTITKLEKTAGDTEQIAGNDTISSSWNFTATYASGKTVNLTAQDVKSDIDTKTVGENKTATVTYSYKDSKGVDKTITTQVSYTIKAKPAQEGDVTYTMTYQVKTTDASAKTGGWETKWKDNSEDIDNNVTITTTTANYLTKEKSTSGDNAVTFSDYTEVKGQSDKSITINVGAKATDVSITVYFSHTSKASRALYIANNTTVGTDNANVLDYEAIGTAEASPSALYVLNASNLSDGKYYVYSDGSTVHVYAVVVEYTIKASGSKETVTSIDFSDTTNINANAQLASSSETGLVAIQDTGFSVTKCGSADKYTLIGAQNKVQCLQFQGTGAIDKNSIAVTVGAGEVTIEMKYFQGSAGRYLKVLNANLDTTAASDEELTTADKSIKTRTVTFTLTEETVIYIGSASSGLYVTGITITVVGK